jgi:hypothetical protein
MPKRKYSIETENETTYEVNGVKYRRLEDVPDPLDREKLENMQAALDETDPEALAPAPAGETGLPIEDLISWIFGGVAVILLLIAGLSAFSALRTISAEVSAPGVVVKVVLRQQRVTTDNGKNVVEETYYPVVRFSAEDGRRREVQLTEGSYPASYEAGDEVTIRYNPEHPLEARIDSWGSTALKWILPAITGILGLSFLLAVLGVRWVIARQ